MKVTIEIPDSLPQEHLQQKIKEIEASLREEENLISEATRSNDPWTNPDIKLPSVDTKIEDLSINHDHYLYGTPKKS